MNAMTTLYRPTQEERSRQAFVGALKTAANHDLESVVARRYEERLLPAYREAHGGAEPADRAEARPLFEKDPAFQLWSALTYRSQDLLWETCGETVDRLRADFEARAAELEQREPVGSLQLAPELEKPDPIGSVNIHRQPGGYFYRDSEADLTAALLYMATVEIYRAAKGFRSNDGGSTAIGRQFAAMVQKVAPGLKPRRILDIGCGVGHMAIGLKEAWPDAEVHAVDLSASFVRLGHLWAEEMELPVHFRQADAAATGLEGEFDLIVSQILFHETWHDKLPAIFREAQRLLSRDGVFFNVDTPYQPARLTIPQMVTNDWQVQYNGEPFWTGFADTDVLGELKAAGFGDRAFSRYMAPGGGREYFIFGAMPGQPS